MEKENLRYEEQEIEINLNNENISGFMIRKFEIYSNINEHCKLEIEFEITEEKKDKFESFVLVEDCKVEINVKRNNNKMKKINLFTGQIIQSKFKVYGNNGYKFSFVAHSKSEMLDREKKYRVFQDVNMSYEEIINEIMKEYKNIKIIVNDGVKEKIGDIIVQFGETDYEFLIRIASHLGMGIISTDNGVLSFGFTNSTENKIEDMVYTDYEMVNKNKNIIYKIDSSQVFNNGNSVILEINRGTNNFKIIKSKIFLKRGLLFGNYELVLENYKIDKKLNEKIKGSVVEGIVEKVFEENNIAVMNVKFYQGLLKYGKAYSDYGISKYTIPYMTFYSQTNTGFFCTPEINDRVDIVFLSNEEKFLRVIGSVNNNGNGRFSNYTKRNFHINQKDFSFDLNLNNFEIKTDAKYSVSSPNILEIGENVVNKAKKNMIIASDDYLGIESIGATDLYASKIDVVGKEKEINIEALSGDIRMKAKKVHSN